MGQRYSDGNSPISWKISYGCAQTADETTRSGRNPLVGPISLGFPITGSPPQRFTFEKEAAKFPRIPCKQLYVTAPTRFRDRVAKSGFKNAKAFRGESLQQMEKGWVMPPTPLDMDGRPFTWRSSQFNISFRYGVEKAGKLRAFDNLNHSVANLACSVHTPILLASWDHISHMVRFLAKKEMTWPCSNLIAKLIINSCR